MHSVTSAHMLLCFSSEQAGLCGLLSYSVLIYGGNDEPKRYFISWLELWLLKYNVYIHVVFTQFTTFGIVDQHYPRTPVVAGEMQSYEVKLTIMCQTCLKYIIFAYVGDIYQHWNTCERLILAHIFRCSVKGPIQCKKLQIFSNNNLSPAYQTLRDAPCDVTKGGIDTIFRSVTTPSASCSSLWDRLVFITKHQF